MLLSEQRALQKLTPLYCHRQAVLPCPLHALVLFLLINCTWVIHRAKKKEKKVKGKEGYRDRGLFFM